MCVCVQQLQYTVTIVAVCVHVCMNMCVYAFYSCCNVLSIMHLYTMSCKSEYSDEFMKDQPTKSSHYSGNMVLIQMG